MSGYEGMFDPQSGMLTQERKKEVAQQEAAARAAAANKSVIAPSAASPLTPRSVIEAIGGAFAPLWPLIGQSQQMFAAMPYAGARAAVPMLTGQAPFPEPWREGLYDVRAAQRQLGAFPAFMSREMQNQYRTLGDVFAQSPAAANSLLAAVTTPDQLTPQGRYQMAMAAREHMRRVRAMGPQNAFAYGVMSGQIDPIMAMRMAGPMATLALAQQAAATDAARFQAMGQAMPGAAQAYSQAMQGLPQAMAQLAMAPMQAGLQSQAARLQAAQIAQAPYLAALQAFPGFAQSTMSAALAPPATIADWLKGHQIASLNALAGLAENQ